MLCAFIYTPLFYERKQNARPFNVWKVRPNMSRHQVVISNKSSSSRNFVGHRLFPVPVLSAKGGEGARCIMVGPLAYTCLYRWLTITFYAVSRGGASGGVTAV
jgi:hypothetical protein